MNSLFWRDIEIHGGRFPAGVLAQGEHMRLIAPGKYQYAWLEHLFTPEDTGDKASWLMWLQTETASYQAGSCEFLERVGTMLRHRGLLANLSLRENLLLPFLYRGKGEQVERAEHELGEVAEFLGIADALDTQAGERSPFTHALISLGRCLLLKTPIIIAQEVHTGLSPARLMLFRDAFEQALDRLQAGLLYLTASEHEGSGIAFDRTLSLEMGAKAA